ncbi:MAG: trypsin-like peptidase domain-containing protein, partial [Verrucomicrobia bacterium]|nr:trypsin-like peptidase domain-containing protein [Verrucomicrobiota bacterium]
MKTIRAACLLLIAALVAVSPTHKSRAETSIPCAEPADPHAPPAAQAERPAPPRRGEPINDQAVRRYLENSGAKLVHAGRAARDLRGQLDRRTCELRLPAAAETRLTVAGAAARAEPGVMLLGEFYLCQKCSRLHMGTSTGFIIADSGAMVTSLHIFGTNNVQGIVAMTRDGELCPAREVLAADPVHDLLILQLDGKGFVPLPLSTRAAVGSPVSVLSHPDNHFYMLTTGIVSRYTTERKAGSVATMMTITADFAKGSIGAPVINESGAVVGVVTKTRSIYYVNEAGRKDNLQMVIKDCSPAQAVLKMIR